MNDYLQTSPEVLKEFLVYMETIMGRSKKHGSRILSGFENVLSLPPSEAEHCVSRYTI